MTNSRIDVHAHYLTPGYLKALDAAGMRTVDGFPLPKWSLDACLETMDRFGTRASVLSVSSPGVTFVGGQQARDLARELNKTAAGFVKAQPTRIAALAVLPLPDVDGALSEIAHALDVLRLDGVGLLTNYGGAYLGDQTFAPIFDELNRRRAVVHIHPTKPKGFENVSLGYPAPVLEYPFDTTRAINSLIMSGTLGRYPDLKLIVSHGGGAIPYLAERCTPFLAQKLGGLTPELMKTVGGQLRGLFYDITASTSPTSLAALLAFVPPSQLLWGFDFPFMPTPTISNALDNFGSDKNLTSELRERIDHGNAGKLFPRLLAAGEDGA